MEPGRRPSIKNGFSGKILTKLKLYLKCLLEILEFRNFGGKINTDIITFQSPYKILLVTTQALIMTLQPLLENTFILRNPAVF